MEVQDGSLEVTEICLVQWGDDAEADMRPIHLVEENDVTYVFVEDVATALGVRSMRRACADQTLSAVVRPDVPGGWFWFKVEGEFRKCMGLSAVPAYALEVYRGKLCEAGPVNRAAAWARLRDQQDKVAYLAKKRKRRSDPIVVAAVAAEPEPEPLQEEEDWRDFFREEESSSSWDQDDKGKGEEGEDDDGDGDGDDDAVFWGEAVDDEEEEEKEQAGYVELTFADMERLNDIHAKRIQTCAMMLTSLPQDSRERVAVQVAMHNSNAVLDAIHPIFDPREVRRVRFPNLPVVGRQVRVGDRLSALGYDPVLVAPETYMQIGVEAAQLYRAGNLAGPWKISAWAGNQLVERHYYTEETQHYIDQAIHDVFREG